MVGAPQVDPLFPQRPSNESLLPVPLKAPDVRGRLAPFRASAGALGKYHEPFLRRIRGNRRSFRTRTLRDSLLSFYGHADLPSASAPAYRRFRVTGDAEPPGLAHQNNLFFNLISFSPVKRSRIYYRKLFLHLAKCFLPMMTDGRSER